MCLKKKKKVSHPCYRHGEWLSCGWSFDSKLCLSSPWQAVHTLIALQRRYLDSLGNLSPAEEDTIWQVIIGQRSQVCICWKTCGFLTHKFVSRLWHCRRRPAWEPKWCFITFLYPDRSMRDEMSANASSQPGSAQSRSARRQRRRRTPQVCVDGGGCAAVCELLGWHVVMLRQVFPTASVWMNRSVVPWIILQKLLKLMFITFPVGRLSVLHFPQCLDHLLSLCKPMRKAKRRWWTRVPC